MTHQLDDPRPIFGSVAVEMAALRQQILELEDAILTFLADKQLKPTGCKLGSSLQDLDRLTQTLAALEGVLDALSGQSELCFQNALNNVTLHALRERLQANFETA